MNTLMMHYKWLQLRLTWTLVKTMIVQHYRCIVTRCKYVHNALEMYALREVLANLLQDTLCNAFQKLSNTFCSQKKLSHFSHLCHYIITVMTSTDVPQSSWSFCPYEHRNFVLLVYSNTCYCQIHVYYYFTITYNGLFYIHVFTFCTNVPSQLHLEQLFLFVCLLFVLFFLPSSPTSSFPVQLCLTKATRGHTATTSTIIIK